MGTSCFVIVTTNFCVKSPAPRFELSIFFSFTVKVSLFDLLGEEEKPFFTGFMSFTFDETFPLPSEAMTHKPQPKSLSSLTTTSREKIDPRERKCWAQIKDAARTHHDHLRERGLQLGIKYGNPGFNPESIMDSSRYICLVPLNH
ncbi:hypothetical protein AMTRI_Chr06g172700 [Amborella trichopoda]